MSKEEARVSSPAVAGRPELDDVLEVVPED